MQKLNMQTVIQGCMLAVLVWFGQRIVIVSETVAVHEWRLTTLEKPMARVAP